MEHRKTPGRRPFVPSTWFIVLTGTLCVLGLVAIGWLVVRGNDDAGEARATATTPTTSATPEPTPSEPSEEPTPEPSDDPEPTEPTDEPTVRRDASVTVLNQTGVRGAAAAYAQRVRDQGWTTGRVGNWNGAIPSTTVYYGDGLEEQARQLGRDMGLSRILPRVAPMKPDRLTIVLADAA